MPEIQRILYQKIFTKRKIFLKLGVKYCLEVPILIVSKEKCNIFNKMLHFSFLIKTMLSFLRCTVLRFHTVFNDLLGIRMKITDYSEHYPEYFRVADMRQGKKNYDGCKDKKLFSTQNLNCFGKFLQEGTPGERIGIPWLRSFQNAKNP